MASRTVSSGKHRNRGTNAYYVEGTAVRAARPQLQPEPERRERRHRVRRLHPRYREAERTAFASLNLPLTLILVAAVSLSVFVGYRYLCLKSSLDTHMSNIKTLETTLDTMRTENDALEKSIDTSVDLNKVYDIATKELGMVRVGRDNIIQYDKTESEYVKQYEDIPSGE